MKACKDCNKDYNNCSLDCQECWRLKESINQEPPNSPIEEKEDNYDESM